MKTLHQILYALAGVGLADSFFVPSGVPLARHLRPARPRVSQRDALLASAGVKIYVHQTFRQTVSVSFKIMCTPLPSSHVLSALLTGA